MPYSLGNSSPQRDITLNRSDLAKKEDMLALQAENWTQNTAHSLVTQQPSVFFFLKKKKALHKFKEQVFPI